MPSIWIASRSRSSSLVSIHAFIRAADNATKRREVADFDSPAPSDAGTSPSGNRTERLKRRVETLISIWFDPVADYLDGRTRSHSPRSRRNPNMCYLPFDLSFRFSYCFAVCRLARLPRESMRLPENFPRRRVWLHG